MKKADEKRKSGGTILILIMAVVNMLLGLVMLMIPGIRMLTLCYIFISVLVILGIGLIVQYFMSESYQYLNRYGFSIGVLCVLLGMCALVKAEELAGYFVICLGIWILTSAIIKLQHALDLKALMDGTWAFWLIISAIIAFCAVIVIIDPFSEETYHTYLTYIVLVADGALSIVSTAYLAFKVKRYNKAQEIQMGELHVDSDSTDEKMDQISYEDIDENTKIESETEKEEDLENDYE